MRLNVNEINHQYITKIVILALFIYRRQIRNTNLYRISVLNYVKRRIIWEIDLRIDTGIKLEKDDERDIVLDEILYGIESDYLKRVIVTFISPLKETTIEVDLSNESMYEKFLYS